MTDRPSPANADANANHAAPTAAPEWEAITRTMAHLAAQLTLSQIRLRALATELQERGLVEPATVSARVRALAAADAGGYLRENLGEALVAVIDVEALERELVAYVSDGGDGGGG